VSGVSRASWSVSIAVGTAVAVLLGLLPAQATSADRASAAGAARPETPAVEIMRVVSRLDAVSAMTAAGILGVRVEDLSQRSETSRVLANPDGTWTTEEATGPVRVRRADGSWAPGLGALTRALSNKGRRLWEDGYGAEI
jgi:hypothetical protein